MDPEVPYLQTDPFNPNPNLVGGLEHEFYDFPYIGNVIIPANELIFFRGIGQPPTSHDFMPLKIPRLAEAAQGAGASLQMTRDIGNSSIDRLLATEPGVSNLCYTDKWCYMTGWWFQTCFIFHHIWDVILPIDELLFFKVVVTTNQMMLYGYRKSMKSILPKMAKCSSLICEI